MTKQELAKAISSKTGITQDKALHVLDTLTNEIVSEIVKGGKVAIRGFGSFSQGQRAARMGRNPVTGEQIDIPACKTLRFAPAEAVKIRVN